MKKTPQHHQIFFLYIGLAIFCFSSMGNFIGDENTDAPGDAGSCATDCHYKIGGTGNVMLLDMPSTYEPETVYNMSLLIQDTDESEFPARRAGFQIVATDGTNNAQIGTFTSGSGTRITSNGRIADSPHKTFTGDAVEWAIQWIAPSTITPDHVTFYYAAISGDGDGLKDRETIGQDSEYRGQNTITLASSLAVDFISFEAKLHLASSVILDWTVEAIAHKGFYLQRASQHGEVFENIAWIPAKNIDNTHRILKYRFEDKDISTGKTYYYRLQQEEENGKLWSSEIQTVFIPQQLFFDIYPNPVAEVLRGKFALASTKVGKIRILNNKGQIIEELERLEENENSFFIPVHDYAKGLYWIQVFSDDVLVANQKFVKN